MSRKKKRKGRQDVKRHWKPSLGRFVDNYDRRGENARANERAPRRAAATDADTTPAGRPHMVRRLVISAVVFAVMLGLIGGFRLARERRAVVEYDVLVARKPVTVKIDHGTPTRVLTARGSEFDALVRDAVGSVRAVAAEHGDRLIVIELVTPAISFDSLSAPDQRAVKRAAGPETVRTYENAVARFIERVVDAAASPRVSILGLPVEPGAAGIEAARLTNRRYHNVIERLDHIVTAHIFFRTDSWVTERQMVEDAIPEALHRSDGRPIVFRLNLEWRVLVDRSQVGRYRRAEWNTLE